MLSVVWSSGTSDTACTSGNTIGDGSLIVASAICVLANTVPTTSMVSAVNASLKPAAFESVGVSVIVCSNVPLSAVERSTVSAVVPPAANVPNAPRPVSLNSLLLLALTLPDSQSAGPVAVLAIANPSVTSPEPIVTVPRSSV